MADLTVRDDVKIDKKWERPPLSLQKYFDERDEAAQDLPAKSPGPGHSAYVVGRRDNLIVLEFQDVPPVRKTRCQPMCRGWWDAAMILLLIASTAACVLSFLR